MENYDRIIEWTRTHLIDRENVLCIVHNTPKKDYFLAGDLKRLQRTGKHAGIKKACQGSRAYSIIGGKQISMSNMKFNCQNMTWERRDEQ